MLEVMNGQADRVQIEVLLTPRCLDNYIIALFPKKLATAARKDFYDIATFTKPMSHAQLTDRLVLLTDCPEAVDALFTPSVIAIINHFAPYIQKIHITDQWIYKPTAYASHAPFFKRAPLTLWDPF